MSNGRIPSPPAMTVTVEVDGGPTVRLAYDGRWGWVGRTRIMVSEQAGTNGPGYLVELLLQAGAVLWAYADARADWPADLRPAPRSPQAPEECKSE